MAEETLIVINALVDDYVAAEDVLRSFVRRELPGAQVLESGNLHRQGFELVTIIPAAMSFPELKERVSAELDQYEILHAELRVVALDEDGEPRM